MSSAFEKALSIDWNGKVFILTMRNEIIANTTVSGNTFLYSYNGINWLPSSNINTVDISNTNPLNIKWIGDRYLMETQQNILQSKDGLHWESSNVSVSKMSRMPIYDVETNLEKSNTIQFPQNTTLALGGVLSDSTKIAYSTDSGITWIPTNSVFSTCCNNAVWNGKLWVAVGQGGNTIATSQDGRTWIGRGSYIFTTQGNSVDWSKELSMWVAVGSGTNSIAYSYDGVYWTPALISNSQTLSLGLDIKWNSRTWVAVGSSTQFGIYYSNDGITWISSNIPSQGYNNISKILWNGSYWSGIVGGNLITSADGISWNSTIENIFQGNTIINGCYSARTNETIYISNSNNIFTTTVNSTSFNISQTSTISNSSSIIYNGTYYLLGGNAVATSLDSNLWTYGNTITGMSQIKNFAWNNPDQGSISIAPISVALGSGSNTIAYSNDGIYWIGTGNSIFTTKGNKAVWNGTIWCAVGTGSNWVATSYDGINWIGRDNYWMQEGYDIGWNGSVFIAVGYGVVTMAVSTDGIIWEGIVATPLDKYASSIIWSGQIWIAYGSGTTTSTAYSSQLLGNNWKSTIQPSLAIQNGQTVFTPSYFTSSTLSGFSATSSSLQTNNEPYKAFDNNFSTPTITSWYSASNTYSSTTGLYTGSQTTSYDGTSINGEWLQIALPAPTTIIYYYIVFSIDSAATAIPKMWILLGSQDGSSWSTVDTFTFGSITNPPNNTNSYPFLVIPRNIISVGATYQYYRIVIPAIFGGGSQTFAQLAEFDLYTSTSTSNQIAPYIRPIVTNTHILHPTNLLNIQGIGKQTIYIPTDLCGNIIQNYYLNQSGYANSTINGLEALPPIAQAFDGQNYLVLAKSGSAAYITTQSANTTLDFSTIYNGETIQTNLQEAYAAAYNKKSILLGGINNSVGSITYATLGTKSTPIFQQTNASTLFTAVYGISSNSGYGPTYIPNALYLKPQDKISVISPKSYPYAISNTSITINLTNAKL